MLVEQLTLSNLLSFGTNLEPIALGPLNLIIGPNGSGKSNLLEAIDLLKHAPGLLSTPVREGGGIRDWLWKGAKQTPTASINAVLANPKGPTSLRYVLSFTEVAQRFEIVDERIENEKPDVGQPDPYFYYHFERGHPVLNIAGKKRVLKREVIDVERSILAQRRDPDQYPEITYLAEILPSIRLYREWTFGRYTAPRLPQKVDLSNRWLEADGSNLGLVLNRLRRDSVSKTRLLDALRKLYDGIDDFDVQIEGGTVQVFFLEGGMTIPATRLSDGTLRYLCLLACRPLPPQSAAIGMYRGTRVGDASRHSANYRRIAARCIDPLPAYCHDTFRCARGRHDRHAGSRSDL
jgi:predicted ATPase